MVDVNEDAHCCNSFKQNHPKIIETHKKQIDNDIELYLFAKTNYVCEFHFGRVNGIVSFQTTESQLK